MYVKSIVIDGFKSYGNRVEINGFDREFNAITGFNGTGKSNILDAICFVLGLSDLTHVRAGSLQELVYKLGQAGVTKASVSITFDNSDKEQTPIGYENHEEITITRQVVIGGKNKYLINGINVQNKRVIDLFCSVQLNVNNPHFLIMQGRITKVLNMKPPEILSMVEEAAGTKMYETKKQETEKTIIKKDAKLKELNDIITEEITPKLSKLKEERSQYQEYQKVVRELENLIRLYVAWKYVSAEESVKNSKKMLNEVKDKIKSKHETISDNKNEYKRYESLITEMNEKLDKESGGELKSIEKELQDKETIEANISANLRSAQDSLTAQKSKQRLLQNNINDDEKAFSTKSNQLNEMENSFGSLRDKMNQDSEALTQAQDRFHAASSGLQLTEKGQESLQDELMAANQAASEASTQITQLNMEKEHITKRLKELQKEMSTSGAQFKNQQGKIDAMEKEVQRLHRELTSIEYDEDLLSNMQSQRAELSSSIRSLSHNLDRLNSELRRCTFNYKDPAPNFDRRKVKGLVCRLVRIKDPRYAMALEVAGGERLYNVIVDNEVTSKLIIKNGQLQSRTTMIPLNQIRGRTIEREKIRLAEQLVGPDNVKSSLSLVEYDQSLRPAMEWVFGESFVCPNLTICQKVAFHPQIMKRCITMDGDTVDPRGTLSGGSARKEGSVLQRLEELMSIESRIQPVQTQLSKLDSDIKKITQSYDPYIACKQKYERKLHELNAAKQQMKLTASAELASEIDEMKENLQQMTSKIEELKKVNKENVEKERDLRERMKDLKGHRERQLKAVEEDLKNKKKQADISKNAWKKLEHNFDTLKLEVSELQKSVDVGREQLAAGEETLQELIQQTEKLKEEQKNIKEIVKVIQSQIKTKKADIATQNKEIKGITQKKEQLLASNADIELEIKELEHEIAKMKSEAASCEDKINGMKEQYEWITSEREYFGEPGGLYDFKERDPRSAGQRISQLEKIKDKLGRNLNTRAQTLLGKEEEQHNAILQKKAKVENDRATLINTIQELDATKRKAVIKACEQVNKDFGSIYSTLLPGAQVKLIPQEGKSVLEGLQVKFAFNDYWKDDLNELSGGQRSLVALSLILAMLLFHPAPLYILDEVDAALDLSHTQNIGDMLSAHFKKSQFIIVSLKDGMFSNANVLFRTKLVDGMSTVQRTAQKTRR